MELLVIEDELKLVENRKKVLTASSCVVDLAHDGIDGLQLAVERVCC